MKKLVVVTFILAAVIAGVIVFLPKECAHEYPEEYEILREPSCAEEGVQAKKCIHCGEYTPEESIEKLAHSANWTTILDATCIGVGMEQEVCSDCKTILNVREIPMVEHVKGEDIIDKEATCTEEGQKHAECVNCGQAFPSEIVKATGHSTKKNNWIITLEATCTDKGKRDLHCDICDTVVKTEETKASGHMVEEWTYLTHENCEKDGEQSGVCTVCGRDCFRLIDAWGHRYTQWLENPTDYWSKDCPIVAPTCTENGVVYRFCSTCKTIESKTVAALGHTVGEWETDAPATCTTEGKKHRSCVTCGVTIDTETIPAQGHVAAEWIIDAEANCTVAGKKHRCCDDCGVTVEIKMIPATGHTASAWVIDTAATCLTAGEKHQTCQTCKVTVNVAVIPATGHTADNWTTKTAATCTAEGCDQQFCKTCKTLLKEKTTPIAAHRADDWSITLEPTCHTMGKAVKKCKVCGLLIETKDLPMTEHDFVEITAQAVQPTCSSNGKRCYKCTAPECHATMEETIEKLNHVISDTPKWTIVFPATCKADGKRTANCNVCGEIVKTEVIPATNHTYLDSTKVVIPATCDQDGSLTNKCSADGCAHTMTEVLPKLGHSYACTPQGKDTLCYTCTNENCQSTYTEKIPAIKITLSVSRNEKDEGAALTIHMKEYLISADGGFGELKYQIAHYIGDELVEEIPYIAGEVISINYRVSKNEKNLHRMKITVTDTLGNQTVAIYSLETDKLV